MRKLILVSLLATTGLGLAASGAQAETWSGDCNFKGTGTFDPPYTYVVKNYNYSATGRGTCTGALNGKKYKGPAAVRIDGRMKAPMSCEGGFTPSDTVPGAVIFGRHPGRVHAKRVDLLLLDVHSVFADNFFVQGAYNGAGYGRWIFTTGLDTTSQCLPQKGVARLKFDMVIQTIRRLYG